MMSTEVTAALQELRNFFDTPPGRCACQVT